MANEFLDMDPNCLDEMWLEQPRLYHKYAKKLATAKQKLEEDKAELELCKAELDRDIRSNPSEFSLEKITENVVANTIITQEKFRALQAQMLDTKHQVDVLGVAVTTLDHRKRALENLVSLHGQDYFSSPRAKDNEAIQELEKAAVRKRRN
tara:strand:+ start:3874 stop:4326 length:453 start_codon:yes stop_codon:yes gene_type:complete